MEKDGKSVNTISKTYYILYDIMNYAFICDLIVKNPCIGIKLPKMQEECERRVLSSEEQNVFVEAIKGTYYEDFYIVALGTGMRINEILALTWDDVDFNKGVIHVNKTLVYIQKGKGEKGYLQFQKPKTKAGKRDIPMLPTVEICLNKRRTKQNADRIKYKEIKKPQKGMENLVFTSETGKPIHDKYIRKNLKYIVSKINKEEKRNAIKENRKPIIFEDMTPHTLRHSFATRAFESGMKPKTVQEILGHSSLAMTMDLYTHVTDDTKKKEMDKLKHII